MYNRRCNCGLCVKAAKDYKQSRIDKRDSLAEHGTNKMYQLACRCQPCKDAHTKYNRKSSQLPSTMLRRKTRLDLYHSLKNNPCTDCGNIYHLAAMEFDHTSDDKIYNVGSLFRDAKLDLLLTEIAKCELVCANCHRVRTFNRRREKGYVETFV